MELKERIEELEWVLKELNRFIDKANDDLNPRGLWAIGPAAVQLQITINSMKESIK